MKTVTKKLWIKTKSTSMLPFPCTRIDPSFPSHKISWDAVWSSWRDKKRQIKQSYDRWKMKKGQKCCYNTNVALNTNLELKKKDSHMSVQKETLGPNMTSEWNMFYQKLISFTEFHMTTCSTMNWKLMGIKTKQDCTTSFSDP